MSFVDLHVHSTASDGTLSPREVTLLAKELGLSAYALTDHDTTAGIEEAVRTSIEIGGPQVIPGIEVSSSYSGKEIHILGLFLRPEDPQLQQMLDQMRRSRDERNRRMLENLAADGITFTPQELTGENPDTVITRAHVARALIQKGVCSNTDQAFRAYLSYGGKYCPQKEHLSPEQVVSTLRNSGAFVALAHPYQYKLGDKETERLIAWLKELGMEGLEVYHSSHNPLESRKLRALGSKYDLLSTGGSDFHGANKPDVSLGTGRGGLRVSSLLLKDIYTRIQSRI